MVDTPRLGRGARKSVSVRVRLRVQVAGRIYTSLKYGKLPKKLRV